MEPLISVQILNWNRAEETQRAIQSALDQTYENIEIVMVDNGSTDNSVALTKSNFPSITIVQLDRNYGCPGGRNKGIEHCKGEYIFYLDNDGLLHELAVENAYRSIISEENIGIVTGVVYDFITLQEVDTKCKIKNDVSYLNNLFQGGICLHDVQIYSKIGFYPSHFIYGAEEKFLSLKALDSDYKILKDESVILWHKQSDFARDKTNETLNAYFNNLYLAINLYPTKNAVLFIGYFLIKYPFYASKEKVLNKFLKRFKTDFLATIKGAYSKRNSVSKSAYKKFITTNK